MVRSIEGFMDVRNERRACKRCGYVRLIPIRTYPKSEDPTEEHFSRYCGMCELIRSAEVHDQTAARFRKRAAEMLAKRKAREKKGDKNP
jgi:hypothetical protein